MLDCVKRNMRHLPEENIIQQMSLSSNEIVLSWNASGKNRISFLKWNTDWLKENTTFDVNSQSLGICFCKSIKFDKER